MTVILTPPHLENKETDDATSRRSGSRSGGVSPPRKAKPQRHGSDSDLSPPRGKDSDGDMSPPRRKRHGLEEERKTVICHRQGKGMTVIIHRLGERRAVICFYKDDNDLDKMMREMDREGDPMAAFLKKKKKKEDPVNGWLNFLLYALRLLA
jgi:hypothetical protein